MVHICVASTEAHTLSHTLTHTCKPLIYCSDAQAAHAGMESGPSGALCLPVGSLHSLVPGLWLPDPAIGYS